eukprot:6437175-Prymnesium_polylepis.2
MKPLPLTELDFSGARGVCERGVRRARRPPALPLLERTPLPTLAPACPADPASVTAGKIVCDASAP